MAPSRRRPPTTPTTTPMIKLRLLSPLEDTPSSPVSAVEVGAAVLEEAVVVAAREAVGRTFAEVVAILIEGVPVKVASETKMMV